MSLTYYLTSPDHLDLRLHLRNEFQRPRFDHKLEIKALPQTKNYGIVGTAFDYIVRFTIQHHHKNKCVAKDEWVADIAFRELQKILSPMEVMLLKKRYERSKETYQKFLKSGKPTDALYVDAIFLAKLDLYVRSRYVAPDFSTDNRSDIKDLKKLHQVFPISDFKVKERCFLNPVFGKGSIMVGGADADIILDDTLIDIKVTKHLKLEREYLNQLIGYYILALIGGINKGYDGSVIKNVAIYFARYGLVWKIPLTDLGDTIKFESFKNYFTAYFDKIRKERLAEVNERLEKLRKEIELEKKNKGKSKRKK